MDEGAAEAETLGLAFGELVDETVGERAEVGDGDDVVDASRDAQTTVHPGPVIGGAESTLAARAAELRGLPVVSPVSRGDLRPDDVEGERQVILEELAAVEDDPDDVVGIRLFESLFPGHPLGREVLGTEDTISSLTRDDVAGFFERWYQPANLVVVGAGMVDHDVLVAQAAARFGDRPAGERPARTAPDARTVARVVDERPVELVHLALAWRTVPADHPDRFAVAALNQLLGAGPSSRLFQEVREERGLAYGISSSATSHLDAGALTVSCSTSAKKAAEVLRVVRGEVEQLAADGPADDEVELALGALRGGLLVSMEDASNRMLRLGTAESLRGGAVPVAEHLARLDAVTPEDVRRVAAYVLGGDEVLAVVGPKGTAKKV